MCIKRLRCWWPCILWCVRRPDLGYLDQHSWLGYVHRHLLRRAPYGRERPCQARAGDRHCVLVPGTMFSLIIMIVAAPTLADFAVGLSAYEFFALTFFALVLVSSVGGKNIFKGLAAALMGLACCMIGMAPVDGAVRYSFGITGLLQGIPLTPAVIGMFAVTEILLNATKPIKPGGVDQRKIEKNSGVWFLSQRDVLSNEKLPDVQRDWSCDRISARYGWLLGQSSGLCGSTKDIRNIRRSLEPVSWTVLWPRRHPITHPSAGP